MNIRARDKEQAKKYRWMLRRMNRTSNDFESGDHKYTHIFTLSAKQADAGSAIDAAMYKLK